MRAERGFLTHLFIVSTICLSLAAGAGAQTEADLWGMKVANTWQYAGSGPNVTYQWGTTVVAVDTTTIPGTTTYYVEGGDVAEGVEDRSWYVAGPTELSLRKREFRDLTQTTVWNTLSLPAGLRVVLNPIVVGAYWTDTINGTFDGSPITITAENWVLSHEVVAVPKGTYKAYKVRSVLTFTGAETMAEERMFWFVPSIGVVKDSYDAAYTEELSSTNVTLPAGVTFLDVPSTGFAHAQIEAITAAGITGGCTAGPPPQFCPDDTITRAQMAVFIITAIGETPSAAAFDANFDDIANDGFAPFINRINELGITGGCGTRAYCPNNSLTRAQMAVFIISAIGEIPSAVAFDANFDDIANDGFAPFINRMNELGITGGCGGRGYCPGDPQTRAQMAVFITTAF